MPFVIQWCDYCEGPERMVRVSTPIAAMVLSFRGDVIIGADWVMQDDSSQPDDHPIQKELARFWLGADAMIPVKLLKQGSEYRNKVWAELCTIPFGATISYSALARQIRSSARSVGNACRDNPFPLIIPCHRVVAAAGLGGYCGQIQGDFMTIKAKLLQFEASRSA